MMDRYINLMTGNIDVSKSKNKLAYPVMSFLHLQDQNGTRGTPIRNFRNIKHNRNIFQ